MNTRLVSTICAVLALVILMGCAKGLGVASEQSGTTLSPSSNAQSQTSENSDSGEPTRDGSSDRRNGAMADVKSGGNSMTEGQVAGIAEAYVTSPQASPTEIHGESVPEGYVVGAAPTSKASGGSRIRGGWQAPSAGSNYGYNLPAQPQAPNPRVVVPPRPTAPRPSWQDSSGDNGRNDGTPTPREIAALLPTATDYRHINTSLARELITGIAELAKPEYRPVIQGGNEFIACYERHEAIVSRGYHDRDVIHSAGFVGIADDALVRSRSLLFECSLSAVLDAIIPLDADDTEIVPCGTYYQAQVGGRNYRFVYSGTTLGFCHDMCSELPGCSAH